MDILQEWFYVFSTKICELRGRETGEDFSGGKVKDCPQFVGFPSRRVKDRAVSTPLWHTSQKDGRASCVLTLAPANSH